MDMFTMLGSSLINILIVLILIYLIMKLFNKKSSASKFHDSRKYKENSPNSEVVQNALDSEKQERPIIKSQSSKQTVKSNFEYIDVYKERITAPFKIKTKARISKNWFESYEMFPLIKTSLTCVECQKKKDIMIKPYKTGFPLNMLHREKMVKIEYLMKYKVGTLTYQNGLEVSRGLGATYILTKCENCSSDYMVVFGIGEINNGRDVCQISGAWKILTLENHEMKVIDTEKQFWYLLECNGKFYLDVLCNQSFAYYSFTIELNESELHHYNSEGRTYLNHLARDIQFSAPIMEKSKSQFKERNVSEQKSEQITDAIKSWNTIQQREK